MAKRNESEEWRVIKAMIAWLQIRGAADSKYAAKWLRQLIPDAGHSALLERLLSGKPPLPEPPPMAMSYPWYKLIDEGEDVVYDSLVAFHLAGIQDMRVHDDVRTQPGVTIRQSWWRVDQQLSEDEYIVTYRTGRPTCRLTRGIYALEVSDGGGKWYLSPEPGWKLVVLAAQSPAPDSGNGRLEK